MKDKRLRQAALSSLIGNLAYSVFHAAAGILGKSWWFTALSAYYAVLAVMRFGVILAANRSSERFLSRFTGGMFLFLAVTLAGITYLSVSEMRGASHHEILMITIALYAFIMISLAIHNLIKSKKQNDPTVRMLRNISFAQALVSIFALQRSMLVSFPGMEVQDISLMNGLTGTGVYLLVFLLGINLLGGTKMANTMKKMEDAVVGGYKKIETGVVDGYKKIESGVVEGYTKLEDKFVGRFLTREGETVEEAKKRLKGEE